MYWPHRWQFPNSLHTHIHNAFDTNFEIVYNIKYINIVLLNNCDTNNDIINNNNNSSIRAPT